MPPDRGRASRACTSCRKQKTRCYEPGIPGRACLRCDRLRQSCSLMRIDASDEESLPPAQTGTDARYELPPGNSTIHSNHSTILVWNVWRKAWLLCLIDWAKDPERCKTQADLPLRKRARPRIKTRKLPLRSWSSAIWQRTTASNRRPMLDR